MTASTSGVDEARPEEMVEHLTPAVSLESGLSPIDENQASTSKVLTSCTQSDATLSSTSQPPLHLGRSELPQLRSDLPVTLSDMSRDLKDDFSRLTEQLSRLDLDSEADARNATAVQETNSHAVMSALTKGCDVNHRKTAQVQKQKSSVERRTTGRSQRAMTSQCERRVVDSSDDDEGGASLCTDTSAWSLGADVNSVVKHDSPASRPQRRRRPKPSESTTALSPQSSIAEVLPDSVLESQAHEMTQSLHFTSHAICAAGASDLKASSLENFHLNAAVLHPGSDSPVGSPRGQSSPRSPRESGVTTPRSKHKIVDTNYKLSTSARVYAADTSTSSTSSSSHPSSSAHKQRRQQKTQVREELSTSHNQDDMTASGDFSPCITPRTRDKANASDLDISAMGDPDSLNKLRRFTRAPGHPPKPRTLSESDVKHEFPVSLDVSTCDEDASTDVTNASFRSDVSSVSGDRHHAGATDLDQFSSELNDRRRRFEAGVTSAPRIDDDVSAFARARRKISDASLASELSAAVCANGGDDDAALSSRVFSRSVSLEQVVSKPEHVPEKLDFSQLEKFEGV